MQSSRRRRSSVAISLPTFDETVQSKPSDFDEPDQQSALENEVTQLSGELSIGAIAVPGVALDREVAYQLNPYGLVAVSQWASYYSPSLGCVVAPHAFCNSFADADAISDARRSTSAGANGGVKTIKMTVPSEVANNFLAVEKELNLLGIPHRHVAATEPSNNGASARRLIDMSGLPRPAEKPRNASLSSSTNGQFVSQGSANSLAALYAACRPFASWPSVKLQNVTMLNLAGGGIGDDGVLVVCHALRFGPLRSCQHVELLYNELTWRSALYFSVFLLPQPPLGLVDVKANDERKASLGNPNNAAHPLSAPNGNNQESHIAQERRREFFLPCSTAAKSLVAFFFPSSAMSGSVQSPRGSPGRTSMSSVRFAPQHDTAVADASDDECADFASSALAEMQSFQSALGSPEWKNAATCVESLRLGWNDLGDEGAKVLAEMIGKQNFLLELSLSHNGLTEEGCAPIREALRQTVSLFSLDLTGNEMSATTAEQIRGALLYNERQHEIIVKRTSSCAL